ncbi:MAG: DUF5658 family protein [Gemmatales bacterium]
MSASMACDLSPSQELALTKRPKLPYTRLILFLTFSITDFLLTKWLLQRSHGDFYESNPLAEGILQNLGWQGLAYFKFSSALCVLAIAIYLGVLRPLIAQRLINFACLVLGFVVTYSLVLVFGFA